MNCHLIEGQQGCEFSFKHRCVAIVVDALRASATASMILDANATELLVVSTVETALLAKAANPDALLFGERGGLPPKGFDYGNSPQAVSAARGRRVIFTTTSGAQRLVACWGAHTIYMGTTTNACAVMNAAKRHNRDIVIIPAGLADDPAFDAQEDWTAAAYLARIGGLEVATGEDQYKHWNARIAKEGIESLFNSAPHAEKLRAINLESDIAWCARVDVTDAVPMVFARNEHGIRAARYKP